MEIWKKINGFENYEVSSFGNIRNLKKDLILKQGLNKDGYPQVRLYNCKITKTFRTHRLVALYFLENKNKKETVNHKNGIKNDNNIDNLEWATRKEQSTHSFDNNLQTRTSNKIVLNTQTGIYYESLFEASKSCGYKNSSLSLKLNGKRKNNTNFIYA